MGDELDVLGANEAFYDAFSRRDIEAIDRLWAAEGTLSCIHPGWDALRGRDEVIASFRAILEHRGSPRIRCFDASAEVFGDMALVVCREALGGEGGGIVATNVFVRAGDRWKMVHHHAGPVSMRRTNPPPPPSSRTPKKKSELN